jgi:hypothetical protein
MCCRARLLIVFTQLRHATGRDDMYKRIVMISAAFLWTATIAHASSIVINGGLPDQSNIYFADTDYAWTATTASLQTFALSGETISGADWWGGCVLTNGTERSAADEVTTPSLCSVADFVLSFYDNNGAGVTPGNVVASFIVAPSQTLTGSNIDGAIPEYHYSASFGPITLPVGQYLFAVSADLPGALTWGMETTPAGESQHFQLNNATWQTPPNDLAFDLVGPSANPVPEPTTLSLVAIGLAGVMRRRRR